MKLLDPLYSGVMLPPPRMLAHLEEGKKKLAVALDKILVIFVHDVMLCIPMLVDYFIALLLPVVLRTKKTLGLECRGTIFQVKKHFYNVH